MALRALHGSIFALQEEAPLPALTVACPRPRGSRRRTARESPRVDRADEVVEVGDHVPVGVEAPEEPPVADLLVYGGLLSQPFEIFMRPCVHLRTIFMGAGERALRDAGADVQFVPSDFRRFARALHRVDPRVLVTSCTPPDDGGWMSLGLVAAEQADELHRYARDPGRLLIALANPLLPRTLGLPPDFPHAIHVDEVDVIVEAAWEVAQYRQASPTD